MYRALGFAAGARGARGQDPAPGIQDGERRGLRQRGAFGGDEALELRAPRGVENRGGRRYFIHDIAEHVIDLADRAVETIGEESAQVVRDGPGVGDCLAAGVAQVESDDGDDRGADPQDRQGEAPMRSLVGAFWGIEPPKNFFTSRLAPPGFPIKRAAAPGERRHLGGAQNPSEDLKKSSSLEKASPSVFLCW